MKDNKIHELFDIMNRHYVENSYQNSQEDCFANQDDNPYHNISAELLENMLTENKAREDCPNIELCRKLQIAQDDICTKGSDTRCMCSFGESRIIMLLARLCSDKENVD